MRTKISAPRVVVIGSSNTDLIVALSRIPGPGETLLGGDFYSAAGGKGANQAVAAARAGGRVSFIGRIGQDTNGREALAGLRKERINVSGVVADPRLPSGVALIFVSQKGENSIAVASGSNLALSAADIARSRDIVASASIVLLQLETALPTVMSAARLARKSGARVILNPAPARSLPDALLRNVTLLTPNEHEASLLSGVPVTDEKTARKAARLLRQRGAQGVIITLGAAGAFVSVDRIEERVPGYKVSVVDTTAAGDVFNGALAVALAQGGDILSAVRFANAAGALSTTKAGAQPSIPTKNAILRLLK